MEISAIGDILEGSLSREFPGIPIERREVNINIAQQKPVALRLENIDPASVSIAARVAAVINTLSTNKSHVTNGIIHDEHHDGRLEQLLGLHMGEESTDGLSKRAAQRIMDSRTEIARIFVRFEGNRLSMQIMQPPLVS